MRCDYRTHDPGLPAGKVYDADTGREIPRVFYFDTETGEYGAYVTDAKGIVQRAPGGSEAGVRWGRARLRFVPDGRTLPPLHEAAAAAGAPLAALPAGSGPPPPSAVPAPPPPEKGD